MNRLSAQRSCRILWLFCGLLLVVHLSSCTSKEDRKAKHLQKARQYAEKNELQKAVIELKNVVQLDPENDAAYLELGEAYLKLRQGSQAFQAFLKATSINPNNLKAQIKLGQILLLGKKTDEARKKAELVLEKAPNDAEALSLLSGVQVQEKNVDGAIETLTRASTIDPKDFNTHLSLARLFLLKGDAERAEKSYLEAISLDPKSNTPFVELSRLYVTKGEQAKAEEILKKMIQEGGKNYSNLQILAFFYEGTAQWEKAEKTYLESAGLSSAEDVTPLMTLAGFYARRGSYEKALEVMNKALETKKGDLDVMANVAQLHFDFRHFEEAEALVDKVLEKDKGHLTANFLKGRLYLARKEYQQALEKFDLLVRERPRSDAGYYYRALTLIQKGDPKLAEPDLLKTLELNPRFLDARLILAETYLRNRDKDLAREQIETAQKIAPKDSRVITLLGNLKMLQQDPKGAEETFRRLVELYPKEATSYLRLGIFYGVSGRPAEAEKNLLKALELNPEQRDALGMLTGVYVQQKKYDEALRLCEGQKGKMGNDPSASAFVEYLEGRVLLSKGERGKALERFEKAVNIDANTLGAYEAIAQIYLAEKRLDKAKEQYETIVRKNPKLVIGHMTLGTIYDQLGDRKKAEASYRAALAIDRDFAPAANNLAWSLIESGGNIDEALGFAQSAKQKMPKNAAVMDTLGWILNLKGSYLNAISELQDAAQLDGSNPMILYHLGVAYYRNNQTDKAREALEKALAEDQNFKEAGQARQLLKEIKTKG